MSENSQTFEQARIGLPEVSPDVSVFWKPLHRLFEDGNPIDPVTVLYYRVDDGKRLPFAAVSRTRGDRLILWPPSDAREVGVFADGDSFAVHHVTLELSSGETHLTRFGATGNRLHVDRSWQLGPNDRGLRTWLIGAFRVALLKRQGGALEQNVRIPSSDSKRRIEEFRRYAAEMQHFDVSTPQLRGDCLVTAMIIADASTFQESVLPSHFPTGSFWDEWIEGWPDGDNFPIVPCKVNVGGVTLVLLTVAPLGRLKGECFIGSITRP